MAMGFGYDRPWRFNSWDRFAIPRPYSQARAVVSPMMHIPETLDRDGIEHYRVVVEQMLNRPDARSRVLGRSRDAEAERGCHASPARGRWPRHGDGLARGALQRERRSTRGVAARRVQNSRRQIYSGHHSVTAPIFCGRLSRFYRLLPVLVRFAMSAAELFSTEHERVLSVGELTDQIKMLLEGPSTVSGWRAKSRIFRSRSRDTAILRSRTTRPSYAP